MIKYDSAIIHQFADGLYKLANTIVVAYTVIALLVGVVLGNVLNGFMTLVGGLLLGAIGWGLGTQKAFVLKLQAQVALCQAQIEENTRGRGVSGGSLPQSTGSRVLSDL